MAKGKLISKKQLSKKRFPKTNNLLFGKIFIKSFLISLAIIVSLSLIYYFFWPKDSFLITREQLLTNPDNFSAQLRLVEIYLENNQFQEASYELTKLNQQIEDLQPEEKIRLDRLWQKKQQTDPWELQKEVNTWQSLLNVYADYRDGYRQLALLYLKLDNLETAFQTIQKALVSSPNDEISQNLKQIILKSD